MTELDDARRELIAARARKKIVEQEAELVAAIATEPVPETGVDIVSHWRAIVDDSSAPASAKVTALRELTKLGVGPIVEPPSSIEEIVQDGMDLFDGVPEIAELTIEALRDRGYVIERKKREPEPEFVKKSYGDENYMDRVEPLPQPVPEVVPVPVPIDHEARQGFVPSARRVLALDAPEPLPVSIVADDAHWARSAREFYDRAGHGVPPAEVTLISKGMSGVVGAGVSPWRTAGAL